MIHASSADAIAEAAARLGAGGLVAIPTETVYGLAADAGDPSAIAKVYAAKGRPRFNPLIVHVARWEEAADFADWSPTARALAQAFWPGPLTLVLPRKDSPRVCDLVCAGLNTVAVRAPAHPIARAVIAAAGRPLAAPSANRSGRISPTTAAHVAAEFGADAPFILDGGPCQWGLESTIVALAAAGAPRLLRPGAIPREMIAAQLGTLSGPGFGEGEREASADGSRSGFVAAPGMLASHYAPRARLRLGAAAPEPGEAYLAFAAPAASGYPSRTLSESGDLVEAAAALYSALRELDDTGVAVISVAPIPDRGLGEAINDRLRRAAAPREAGRP